MAKQVTVQRNLHLRVVLTVGVLLLVQNTYANWWDDLFKTRDQQAYQALIEGDPETASQLFEDGNWRAVATYRNREYEKAETLFSLDNKELNQFNLGNAFAMQARYEDAIAVYEQLIAQNPEHEDAIFNRDLLKKIMEEQPPSSNDPPPDSEQNQSDQDEPNQQDETSTQAESEQDSDQNQEPSQQDEGASTDENEPAELTPEQIAQALQERENADTHERWLRRIPDEPGGLLRTKFRKTTQQRVREGELTREDFDSNAW